MRGDREDLLRKLKKKRGRDLTPEELAAVLKLWLDEDFGNAKLLVSERQPI